MTRSVIVILCLLVPGCGTIPSVRPIGRGERALALSSGGPVTRIYGTRMSVPYSVLRYRQGLTEDTDCHVGVHPTMLVLGNLGMDIGLTKQVLEQSGGRPGLSLEGSIYGFYHFNELLSIRAYPEISLLGSYRLGNRRELFYFGVQNMVQLARPHLVFAPFMGLEISIGKRFAVNLEAKWYAPGEESEDRVVDYSIRPLGHGALGFACGLSYGF